MCSMCLNCELPVPVSISEVGHRPTWFLVPLASFTFFFFHEALIRITWVEITISMVSWRVGRWTERLNQQTEYAGFEYASGGSGDR